MSRRLIFLLPLAVFVIIAIYFGIGLTLNPKILPNMLAGKPAPEFTLKPILGRDDKGFADPDLLGDVTLVNIFGSWCVACQVEHPFLMDVKAKNLVPIHGIDWREENTTDGPNWLKKKGDPYTLVGDDPVSRAAISFGVTGAPETFLIDKKGVIRYKYIGPMNQKVWDDEIWPLIQQLRKPGGA